LARSIRVLIVDDSVIVRKLLTEALSTASDISVVGAAPDALAAIEGIGHFQPDVITLDIEMPKMDGLTFLRTLPSTHPAAVIVVSSLGRSGCSAALQALEAGAVDVVAKPGGPFSVGDLRFVLPDKIRAAYRAEKPRRLAAATATPHGVRASSVSPGCGPGLPLIAIGASTGGTEAVRAVLAELPESCPPILIVQHIPPVFSRAFAERLNGTCRIRVAEAVDGQKLEPGLALVAPGNQHMSVHRVDGTLRVAVQSGPRVSYQRPSVDVLFHSVAEAVGANSVGVILTGMGSDGARGLLRMKQAGAMTVGQDESTCVIYGMPREAVRLDAVRHVAPLQAISGVIRGAAGLA
jgi:two-component system, chemotaxis family, protein-glutamate methylesterase/glutaminase